MGGFAGWTYKFKKYVFIEKRLNKKYLKHGAEFGKISKNEYKNIAIRLIKSSDRRNIEQFISKTGIVLKYNKKTNELILFKDNKFITLYKPEEFYDYFINERKKHERRD